MLLQRARGAERPERTGLASVFVQAVRYAATPILVTAFLYLTRTGSATLLQAFLALLLMQVAWASWLWWKEKPDQEKGFPLFTVLAGMYWMAFGLPLFWNSATQVYGLTPPSTGAITRSLELVVVGMAALYVGLRADIFRRFRYTKTLDLRDAPSSPKYLAAVMMLGLAVKGAPSIPYVFGFGMRQEFMIAAATLPVVAYAILLRRQLMRPVPLSERLLLIVFVGGTVLLGLAGGWLGAGAAVLMVTGCVLIDTRFRIPKLALILVLGYVLFLQPAKEQFRQTYWRTETQSGQVERATEWISSSRLMWEHTLSSSDPGAWRDSVYNTLGRFALLPQTGNVMEMTPGVVPYQGRRMYSYFAVGLIPRAFWRDKPSINEANRFYQVTYGLTAERDLESVSISVGMLTEAYISYGWPGAVIIMMLLGMFFNAVSTIFLSRESGALMKGIGMGLLPAFMDPQAQMAQFLGGFLQQVFLVILVMLPIIHVRRRRAAQREASPRRVRVVAGGQMGGQSVSPPQVTR